MLLKFYIFDYFWEKIIWFNAIISLFCFFIDFLILPKNHCQSSLKTVLTKISYMKIWTIILNITNLWSIYYNIITLLVNFLEMLKQQLSCRRWSSRTRSHSLGRTNTLRMLDLGPPTAWRPRSAAGVTRWSWPLRSWSFWVDLGKR